MEEKKLKTNTKYLVDFKDIEFWKEVKIYAIKEGITIRQLIVNCLKERIEGER